MSMNDPIADFLTRIRNAVQRKHATVSIPASRLKREMARVLSEEGFIESVETDQDAKGHPTIVIGLKYDDQGDSVIRGLKRISRPGLRKHSGHAELEPVLNGQGIAIVTTSQGVLTDRDCRTRQVGGEVLCNIW